MVGFHPFEERAGRPTSDRSDRSDGRRPGAERGAGAWRDDAGRGDAGRGDAGRGEARGPFPREARSAPSDNRGSERGRPSGGRSPRPDRFGEGRGPRGAREAVGRPDRSPSRNERPQRPAPRPERVAEEDRRSATAIPPGQPWGAVGWERDPVAEAAARPVLRSKQAEAPKRATAAAVEPAGPVESGDVGFGAAVSA